MFYYISSKSLVFWFSHLNIQFMYIKFSYVHFKYLTILFINYILQKLKKKFYHSPGTDFCEVRAKSFNFPI